MAGSVNKAILIGRLGRDPEIVDGAGGPPFAKLSVATSQTWRDKASGERKERTEWHAVVVFAEGTVNFARSYLRKGARVYVEGEIRTRKWQDKAGQDRWSTEVVVPRFGGDLQSLEPAAKAPAPSEDSYGTTTTKPPAGRPAAGDDDDLIPF